MNNRVYAQPFIIRAIGEGKTLEAALVAPGSYGQFLKDLVGLYVEIDTGMNIQIPKFSEEYNIKFLNATEEGD